MKAKIADRIATSVFYFIAVFIVAILAGLVGYILVKGLPHISWSFISSPPQTFKEGGGIEAAVVQFFLFTRADNGDQHANRTWRRHLYGRICTEKPADGFAPDGD